MSSRYNVFAGLAVLALGACASVANERLSTISVDGDSYVLRVRTIEGPKGPYEHTSVRVRGTYQICILDSPGDCEAAVRRGLENPFDLGPP